MRDNASRLNPDNVARINLILTALDDATRPDDMDYPGFRLHRLSGNRSEHWSVRVNRNWRITFQFYDGEPVDVNLEDYH